MSVTTEVRHESAAAAPAVTAWTWAAFAVALAALAGSLWLSLGMNLKACPLCLYQRAFVMGAVGVLTAALVLTRHGTNSPAVVALPPAAAGFAVAVWHVALELRGSLECPAGILGVGSAPQQAAAAQGLLLLLLAADVAQRRFGLALAGSLVLGGLLAFAAIRTAPPAAPTLQPDLPLDGCRPPYQPT